MTVHNKITCQAHTHTDINNNLAHITHTPCCAIRTRICIHVPTVGAIKQHPSILKGYTRKEYVDYFCCWCFLLARSADKRLANEIFTLTWSGFVSSRHIYCAWLSPYRPIYGCMSASTGTRLCNYLYNAYQLVIWDYRIHIEQTIFYIHFKHFQQQFFKVF